MRTTPHKSKKLWNPYTEKAGKRERRRETGSEDHTGCHTYLHK